MRCSHTASPQPMSHHCFHLKPWQDHLQLKCKHQLAHARIMHQAYRRQHQCHSIQPRHTKLTAAAWCVNHNGWTAKHCNQTATPRLTTPATSRNITQCPHTASPQSRGSSRRASSRWPGGHVSHNDATQNDQFMALYHSLLPLTRRQLSATAATQPQVLQASFLFWLQDLERAAKKPGGLYWRPSAGSTPGPALPTTSTSPSQASPAPSQNGPTGFVWLSSSTAPAAPESDSVESPSSSPSSSSSSLTAPLPNTQSARSNSGASAPVDSTPVQVMSEDVARLAGELVTLREAQEFDSSRHLLPSLASSLAFDNLLRWRQEVGAPAGTVTVPGAPQVPLEELYRMAEREERRVADAGADGARPRTTSGTQPGWAGARVPWNQNRSGFAGMGEGQSLAGEARVGSGFLDGFASRRGNEMLAGVAAGAMARVRARFMGYEDGDQAAAAVLDTLLWGAYDLGERAEMVDTACTPPGLPYRPPPSVQGDTSAAGGPGEVRKAASRPMETGQGSSPGVGWAAEMRPNAGMMSRPGQGMPGGDGGRSFLGGGGRLGLNSASGLQDGRGNGSGGVDVDALAARLGAYGRAGRGRKSEGPGEEQLLAGNQIVPGEPAAGAVGASGLAAGTMLCITPQALHQEVQSRLATAGQDTSSGNTTLLPCGSTMSQALTDLLEVVDEYDRNVYSRRSGMV